MRFDSSTTITTALYEYNDRNHHLPTITTVTPLCPSLPAGLLRLTFRSDSSIQLGGFSAAYTATATRAVALPSCNARSKVRGSREGRGRGRELQRDVWQVIVKIVLCRDVCWDAWDTCELQWCDLGAGLPG